MTTAHIMIEIVTEFFLKSLTSNIEQIQVGRKQKSYLKLKV
jgi:hypothetical protein